METRAQFRAVGATYLGCGTMFLLVGLLTGHYAFVGVGTAFLPLGLVFIAKGRNRP